MTFHKHLTLSKFMALFIMSFIKDAMFNNKCNHRFVFSGDIKSEDTFVSWVFFGSYSAFVKRRSIFLFFGFMLESSSLYGQLTADN